MSCSHIPVVLNEYFLLLWNLEYIVGLKFCDKRNGPKCIFLYKLEKNHVGGAVAVNL
jgi:hypothetical protein